MATDIKKAANSDNIDDTLSYKTVAKRLIAFIEASEYELVEALADFDEDLMEAYLEGNDPDTETIKFYNKKLNIHFTNVIFSNNIFIIQTSI